MSLDIRPLRASAPLSLQPLRELGRGRLLGRSGLLLLWAASSVASSIASPRSSQHARRRDESREVLVDRSFARSSCVSRSWDRGTRKDRRARSRSDSSRDRGHRSRSRFLLPFAVESVGGGPSLGRCPPASGRDLWIAPALGACALALGETGLDPRIDTALDVTGRGFLTATGHVDSMLVPLLAGELAVTQSPSSFSGPLAVSWTIPSLL